MYFREEAESTESDSVNGSTGTDLDSCHLPQSFSGNATFETNKEVKPEQPSAGHLNNLLQRHPVKLH